MDPGKKKRKLTTLERDMAWLHTGSSASRLDTPPPHTHPPHCHLCVPTFLQAVRHKQRQSMKPVNPRLRRLNRLYHQDIDADGDGHITQAELEALWPRAPLLPRSLPPSLCPSLIPPLPPPPSTDWLCVPVLQPQRFFDVRIRVGRNGTPPQVIAELELPAARIPARTGLRYEGGHG